MMQEKFAVFDCDGNIFDTDFPIYMMVKNKQGTFEQKEFTTKEYDRHKKEFGDGFKNGTVKFVNDDIYTSFMHTVDHHTDPRHQGKNGFYEQIMHAEKTGNKEAPSAGLYKRTRINGEIFIILTSRAHAEETMIAGLKKHNHETLTKDEKREQKENIKINLNHILGKYPSDKKLIDTYFNRCRAVAVYEKSFSQNSWFTQYKGDNISGGRRKALCMENILIPHISKFIARSNSTRTPSSFAPSNTYKIGFSDNMPGNVNAMTDMFTTLNTSQCHKQYRFRNYFTGTQIHKKEVTQHLKDFPQIKTQSKKSSAQKKENDILKIII